MDRPYSLYDVLNVSPGASALALEAAYRALMKQHHPDRTGAQVCNRAAEINAAFSILRDPGRRADYDRREGARQRALLDRQLHKLHRHRRVTGWGLWSAAALVVCAATAYAAQTVALRAASRQQAAATVADTPLPTRLDPVQVVDEVLAEAAEMSLAPRPRPRQGNDRTAAPDDSPAVSAAAFAERPATLRRRAAPAAAAPATQRRVEHADRDFLEREDFIY